MATQNLVLPVTSDGTGALADPVDPEDPVEPLVPAGAVDGVGGAVYKSAYGCYLHGSLLPKNPQLTDHLIGLALARRYGPAASLPPLDAALELRAQRAMVGRLMPSSRQEHL